MHAFYYDESLMQQGSTMTHRDQQEGVYGEEGNRKVSN